MNNLRNYKPKLFTKNNKELRLQIVDWNSYNESPTWKKERISIKIMQNILYRFLVLTKIINRYL